MKGAVWDIKEVGFYIWKLSWEINEYGGEGGEKKGQIPH
jgi:hypothetical protein